MKPQFDLSIDLVYILPARTTAAGGAEMQFTAEIAIIQHLFLFHPQKMDQLRDL